jgi:hypothetical protein
MEFMLKGLKKDEITVLFKITGFNADGYDYFKLDRREYSTFHYEKEVLLRTGLKFIILQISE